MTSNSSQYFYGDFADTSVRLKDGKILKFNKASFIINTKSKVLRNILHRRQRVIDIPDVEYETFKLFMDLSMGFEPYTFENSLKIFSTARKYEVKDSIVECLKSLQLKEITPKLCEMLNMAAKNRYVKLINQTLNLISSNGGIHTFLENKALCGLLQPEAINVLLPRLSLDSFILNSLVKWADEYIKKNHPSSKKGLRHFLKKWNLLRFFQLDCFETTGAIAEFGLSKIGKGFFTLHEVYSHLKNSEDLMHGKSEWKTIKKNESITEEIFIPIYFNSFPSKEIYNCAQVLIKRNRVVFYESKFVKNGQIIMSCKVDFIGQDKSASNLFVTNKEFQFTKENIDEMVYTYETFFNTFSVDVNPRVGCIFKIAWTFFYDCRVLLTNRPGDSFGKDKMYYSKDVSGILKHGYQQLVPDEIVVPKQIKLETAKSPNKST